MRDDKAERDLIITLLENYSEGLSRGEISEKLTISLHPKTLQRRLSSLIEIGSIVKTGDKKATIYYSAQRHTEKNKGQIRDNTSLIFSQKSKETLLFLDIPLYSRAKVSYNRAFLDNYVPNKTNFVPKECRKQLLTAGTRIDQILAAGTYARQICQRLLIDLSYHSSRLEGNTYSRLDTQKLIEENITAEGKIHEETVMIMNHKEAILFLVENAQSIALNSLTIRSLHHLLSQDLLPTPDACGKIRSIAVDIGQSTYKPLSNTHLLTELFELVLLKAEKIEDPFEQSFFLLVQLSYLQAFEDVNKRTSRLACNIPFIQKNLCPLNFTDVPRDEYTAALLAIYEKNDTGPMLELYAWAYLRSSEQYSIVKKSLGGIDGFRIQYRSQKKEVMGLIIKQALHGKKAKKLIEQFCHQNQIQDIAKFTAITLTDLSSLHESAIVGLGITETQLHQWLKKANTLLYPKLLESRRGGK